MSKHPMILCELCEQKIPTHFTSTLVTNWMGNVRACAHCALKVRNEQCSLPEDTPFSGEEAQRMWEGLKRWKEQHNARCKDQVK